MQMLLSANDMEAVLGDKVLNGIETMESRIRKKCMDAIAEGQDLLGPTFVARTHPCDWWMLQHGFANST